MPEDLMLQEAVEAIRQGQRARARDLLTRLLRADSSNPQYWLWMSAVVESIKERTYCLQSVLRLEPDNGAARQGLILVGALPPGESTIPVQPFRRRWEAAAEDLPPRRGLAAVWADPARKSIAVLAVVLLAAIILGGAFALGRRRNAVAMQPTRTPGPPPTFTPTPTFVGGPLVDVVTPSPTFIGPAPLWTLLDATYTPTPLAVNTPHAVSEAFRAGQHAFDRGDWPAALDFFQQAGQVDPAADIQYYVGEVLVRLGDTDKAFAAYDQAISMDPGFAPAYLGRARARLASIGVQNICCSDIASPFRPDPQQKAVLESVEADFHASIKHDPRFGETYLARASYWLAVGEFEAARADLDEVEKLLPGSPLLYLYRAHLELSQDAYTPALELARQALAMDRTLLEAYRTFGLAALVNGDFPSAREALQVYLQHAPANASAWLALSRAWTGLDRPERAGMDFETWGADFDAGAALQTFERAAGLNDELPDLYLYRGLYFLRSGNGQEAVNDLALARRLIAAAKPAEKSASLLFEVDIGLGRALLAAGRPQDSVDQIDRSLAGAETDKQRAAVYYWRAQALEASAEDAGAVRDWQALLDLPRAALAEGWAAAAQVHISALATATPTHTQTQTLTQTPTLTQTSTPKPSATPKVTATPKASATTKVIATPKTTLTRTATAAASRTP